MSIMEMMIANARMIKTLGYKLLGERKKVDFMGLMISVTRML